MIKIFKKIFKPYCINCNNYKNLEMNKIDECEVIFNLCDMCLLKLSAIDVQKNWDEMINNLNKEEIKELYELKD